VGTDEFVLRARGRAQNVLTSLEYSVREGVVGHDPLDAGNVLGPKGSAGTLETRREGGVLLVGHELGVRPSELVIEE
jgi:hypothetical protein